MNHHTYMRPNQARRDFFLFFFYFSFFLFFFLFFYFSLFHFFFSFIFNFENFLFFPRLVGWLAGTNAYFFVQVGIRNFDYRTDRKHLTVYVG